MSYQLDHRSQGSTPHVIVPTWYSGAGVVWSIEFVIEIFSLSSILRLGGHTNGNMMLQINTNGAVTAYNAGTSAVVTSVAGAAIVGVNTIRVESNGAQWTLTVNAEVKTVSNTTGLSQMTYMAVRRGSLYASTELAIRSITTVGGTYSTSWDATNAPATGTSWTSSGGQVGTLTDFSGTTDSWWVFYSTGGGAISASIAATMPQFTASVAASKAAPSFAASVSLSMPQMSAAVSAQNLAPSSGASISFTMPQMSASIIADNAAPVFASAVSVTMPQFAVAASAENTLPGSGAVVSFAMPQMVAAVSASKTSPTYSASVAATMPQFAVSVTGSALVDVKAASISFAMPQFTVGVAGSNVVPIRQASVAFTMPQMRAQVLTGGAAFYQDPRAHIELVAASRHLEYTNPSRHIELRRAQCHH